eukprot:CAMPEP_0113371500 /NCGR_PEP_ID=MMETSP0013_2-20120614/44_1 /TAXON_ID=2843 ORGANISM="Skeletonema costatum, Strain 1716" /NCGR_SAMPLE_ID=MMETSP0013_2 /ASSEMBLY_ACC=CAM_ASM_000158 /LENGTH=583 /DNA_ID=CAMNT_0000253349 /DNA_START=56 /DNA_END=1807 /DNA_ORIENTATION=- /assembly_acc=CAM_ASM_000158
MASSVPPSNPFDGFDTYSTVAAPAMTATQQGAGVPPEYQRPVASVALPQFAEQMLPMVGSGYRRPQQQQPVQHQQPVQQQPVQQQPQQQQQLVPAAPSAMSPWALPPAAPAGQLVATNPFPPPQQQQQQQMMQMDPFAVQMPMMQPQQQQQLVPQYQQQQLLSPQYQIPQQPMVPPQQQQQQQQSTAQQRLQNEVQGFFNDQQPTPQNESTALLDQTDEEGLGLIDVELDDDENNTSNNHNTHDDGEFIGKQPHHHQERSPAPRDKNADIAPPPPITPARPHAEYLAKQTSRSTSSSGQSSSISSPLPKPNLVIHSGYVLSRISFRTVLLRKWKQTFWIQYGPTQLLFFRSFADYEDWLNNPYHTQRARDFLVKLRVDFVSDLKKTSVMGYQVTQIRRKPYGKNVMLHFKLERWMDYGPTIAAAFAAREEEMVHSPTHRNNNRRGGGGGNDGEEYMNTTNDVASLRKIILGCMRNARDAALGAQRGGGGGEDVYRGRYSTDREDYRNNTAGAHRGGSMNDRSGAANMGYHQAFSAESTPRRRMDMDNNEVVRESSPAQESVKTEESAEGVAPVATNGVVDLLG